MSAGEEIYGDKWHFASWGFLGILETVPIATRPCLVAVLGGRAGLQAFKLPGWVLGFAAAVSASERSDASGGRKIQAAVMTGAAVYRRRLSIFRVTCFVLALALTQPFRSWSFWASRIVSS